MLWTFKTPSNPDDGASPLAGLVEDSLGNLYGTTTEGGIESQRAAGLVFELSPPASGSARWAETILFEFFGGREGAYPNYGRLTWGPGGSLYGTTVSGGDTPPNVGGSGVVYRLNPPASSGGAWSETVLYAFPNPVSGTAPRGIAPEDGVVLDSQGAVYGTTPEGGTQYGVTYKLTPPAAGHVRWSETVLHTFEGGKDGADALAALTWLPSGTLAGTTFAGGGVGCNSMGGCGTAFLQTP